MKIKSLFENSYGGDSNVGQIFLTLKMIQQDKDSKGKMVMKYKILFGHFEQFIISCFRYFLSNRTTNQALIHLEQIIHFAKRMEIDANGTTTIGGDFSMIVVIKQQQILLV